MSYLVASTQSLIDLKTFQFSKYSANGNVRIVRPFYMYEPRTQYPRVESKITTVDLNGFSVEFRDFGSWKYGDSTAKIHVNDWELKNFAELSIQVQTNKLPNGMMCVYYSATLDGRKVTDRIDIESEDKFQSIPGLLRQPATELGKNCISWGIRPKQYRVFCNGHELSGTCYALLCGVWAVLLDDELKFDGLALLNGANRDELHIAKILYSLNSYLVKVMMLTK